MTIHIEKPEWLPGAIESMERLIRLHKQGRIPENILGWMIVVDCMRFLRAVYGDDLTTAIEIRKRVLQDTAAFQEVVE